MDYRQFLEQVPRRQRQDLGPDVLPEDRGHLQHLAGILGHDVVDGWMSC
ncbi:hypothetical protein [Glutamicibacter sp. BW78]|nr:hypothetical protein [Glutamicibacter sp. BW78]